MENLEFYYNFEISKVGLTNCLNQIMNSEETLYGQATVYFIKMGLASITLLENAYKSVNFNFQENTLSLLNKLKHEIWWQFKNNKISSNQFLTYCELVGAYLGWCAVKKYNAYFATVENQKVMVLNNKAFNLCLVVQSLCEEQVDIEQYFKSLK